MGFPGNELRRALAGHLSAIVLIKINADSEVSTEVDIGHNVVVVSLGLTRDRLIKNIRIYVGTKDDDSYLTGLLLLILFLRILTWRV